MNVFDFLFSGFSKHRKAMWLYQRGMAKANKGNHGGAIKDYTTIIDLRGVSLEVKGMALFNRALVYSTIEHIPKAIEDLQGVLAMNGASSHVKTEAQRKLARIQKRTDRKEQSDGDS